MEEIMPEQKIHPFLLNCQSIQKILNYLNNCIWVGESEEGRYVYIKFTMGEAKKGKTFHGDYPEVSLDKDDYNKENDTIVIVYTGKLGE